jgi:DNA polymerase-3 subunit alpha
VRDTGPIESVSARLGQKGEGEVSIVVIKEAGQGEVEVALPHRYRIDPRIASAINAVPGVIEVELV